MVDCCCTGGYGYLFTCLPHLHSSSMIPVGQSARNTAICIHAYRPTCSYFMSYLFILEAPYFVFYHLDNSAGCKPRTGHNPSQLISYSLRTGHNPSQSISYSLRTGHNPSQSISYNPKQDTTPVNQSVTAVEQGTTPVDQSVNSVNVRTLPWNVRPIESFVNSCEVEISLLHQHIAIR